MAGMAPLMSNNIGFCMPLLIMKWQVKICGSTVQKRYESNKMVEGKIYSK